MFYLFVGLYFLICPATIFYALGFYFKPGTRTGLVRTGLIYISTEPSNAQINLDSEAWKEKTPAVIRNLTPGYYKVRAEAPGYRPWTEDVPVEAERATVLEKILLLPQKLSMDEVSAESFDDLLAVPKTSWMILSKNQDAASVQLYDLKKEVLLPLEPLLPELKKLQIVRWFLIPKSSQSILEAAALTGDLRYFQIDFDHPKNSRDITSLFRAAPEQVIWAEGEERHLGAVYWDGLDYLRTDRMQVIPKVIEHFSGVGVNRKSLTVLRKDHTLASVSWNGKQERFLLRDTYLGEMLFGSEAPYEIVPLEERLLLFWGPRGQLVFNRLPHILAPADIRGFDFARRSQKLVVWTSSRIGILDLENETDSENFFELGPHIVWVFEKGADIRQALWIYDDSHLVFRDSDRVYFLDLETFSKTEPEELFSVYSHSAISYSETTGSVYFLDPEKKALKRCALAPRHDLIVMPFPARQEKLLKRKRFEL